MTSKINYRSHETKEEWIEQIPEERLVSDDCLLHLHQISPGLNGELCSLFTKKKNEITSIQGRRKWSSEDVNNLISLNKIKIRLVVHSREI